MNSRTRFTWLLFLLLFTPPLLAVSSLNWLKNSPARHFNDADWGLFTKTLNSALDANKSASWENPKSGASGTITPGASKTRDGMNCRLVTLANKANGQTGKSAFTFCKTRDGSWKIAAEQ